MATAEFFITGTAVTLVFTDGYDPQHDRTSTYVGADLSVHARAGLCNELTLMAYKTVHVR